MNRILLTGRMTTAAELRQTPNGKTVTSFGLAVDRQFRNAQGEKETDFINIVLWGKQAEFAANYCGKGKLIAIDGTLQIRKYVDKDGNNRTVAEVIGDRIEGLDRATPENGGQYQNNQGGYQNNNTGGYVAPVRNQQQSAAPASAGNAGDWEMPGGVGEMGDINDPFDDQ